MILYIPWAVAIIVYVVWAIVLWVRRPPARPVERASLALSHLAATWLIVCFVIFSRVFVLNPGSNVAQFAAGSDAGMEMWGLWFDWWLPMIAGIGMALLSGLISLVMPPYPVRSPGAFALKVLGLIICVLGGLLVVPNFPDA